jgi:hypothetical protein
MPWIARRNAGPALFRKLAGTCGRAAPWRRLQLFIFCCAGVNQEKARKSGISVIGILFKVEISAGWARQILPRPADPAQRKSVRESPAGRDFAGARKIDGSQNLTAIRHGA